LLLAYGGKASANAARTNNANKKPKDWSRRGKKGGGDNYRRDQGVLAALKQFYPQAPRGNVARHLKTLAWLISGIVGSQRTNYRAIARKAPDRTKVKSRIKRFSRWVNNERIDLESYFAPYTLALLVSLALVIDGSSVGQDCQALVISLVYGRRALPLGWLVVAGGKGHLSESRWPSWYPQRPSSSSRGMASSMGWVRLQERVDRLGWQYVCRTAKDIVLTEAGAEFTAQELGLRPGQLIARPEVAFTRDQYGPVQVVAWWAKGEAHPIFLVTHLELAQEACWWYKKRFRIETFFSRFPSASKPPGRPRPAGNVDDSRLPGLPPDRLLGPPCSTDGLGQSDPSHRPQ
jgi:hypothetical protein